MTSRSRRLGAALPALAAVGWALLMPAAAQADSGYAVYAGYADIRAPASLFPDPWPSASGKLPPHVLLFGSATAADSVDPDVSAVRIDNTSGGNLTVNDVSVACHGMRFDLGGPGAASPLPDGDTLIVVGASPLDGSEMCAVPVSVVVTVDGAAATFADDAVKGNGSHSAIIGSSINGGESTPWTLLGGGTGSCLRVSGCVGGAGGAGLAVAGVSLVMVTGAAGFSVLHRAVPHPLPVVHPQPPAHGHHPALPQPPAHPGAPSHLQEEAGDKLLEAGGSGLEVGAQNVEERAVLEAGGQAGVPSDDPELGAMRVSRDEDPPEPPPV